MSANKEKNHFSFVHGVHCSLIGMLLSPHSFQYICVKNYMLGGIFILCQTSEEVRSRGTETDDRSGVLEHDQMWTAPEQLAQTRQTAVSDEEAFFKSNETLFCGTVPLLHKGDNLPEDPPSVDRQKCCELQQHQDCTNCIGLPLKT